MSELPTACTYTSHGNHQADMSERLIGLIYPMRYGLSQSFDIHESH